MPVISDTASIMVGPPGLQYQQAVNGAVVNAYKASRFGGTVPVEGTVPPGGVDAGPVTSGPTFGAEGAFVLTVPTFEPYMVAVTSGGVIGWKQCQPILLTTDIIPDANLPADIPYMDVANTFTQPQTFPNAAPEIIAFGLDYTGATNAQAALQARLDSAPQGGAEYGGVVVTMGGRLGLTSPLLIPRGVRLRGNGEAATRLRALPGFAGAAMVMPEHIDGTQEFMWVERMTIDPNGIAAIGLLFDSVYVDSGGVDLTVLAGSVNSIAIKQTAGGAGGPIRLTNVWCSGDGVTGGDRILVADGQKNVWFTDITCENQPAGFAGINMTNSSGNSSNGHKISGFHSEFSTNGSCGILLHNVAGVSIDDALFGGGAPSGAALIRLTGSANFDVFSTTVPRIRNAFAPGSITTVDDQVRGITLAGGFPLDYPSSEVEKIFTIATPSANTSAGTALPAGVPAGWSLASHIVTQACSVVGIWLFNNGGNLTAGSISVSAGVNGGIRRAFQATNDTTHAKGWNRQAPGIGNFTLNPGDQVNLYYDTSSSYVAAGYDYIAGLILAY